VLLCLLLGIMYLIKKTGHLGKVIGYGHQIVKSGYQTTLKVLVVKLETLVIEDL